MMSSFNLFRTCLFCFAFVSVGAFLAPGAFAQETLETIIAEPIEAPVMAGPPMSNDLGFLTGEEAVPEPSMEKLASPSDEPAVVMDSMESMDTMATKDISEPDDLSVIPSLPVEESIDDNIFFDAAALVPTGEMGKRRGPRKVNPRLQPASKFVIVRKNHGTHTQEAGVVAADRAIKLGRYGAALEMYNNLYKKNKSNPNVVMGRATALQNLGRDEEAILAYEEVLETHPNNVEAQVNMLGLIGQRYPAVALQRLVELKSQAPNNVGVVAQLAGVHATLGQYNEALHYLGMASSMEPNNASHLFNIAIIADKAGKKKEAVKYYEQALEIDTIYGGGRSIPREAVFERLARLR